MPLILYTQAMATLQAARDRGVERLLKERAVAVEDAVVVAEGGTAVTDGAQQLDGDDGAASAASRDDLVSLKDASRDDLVSLKDLEAMVREMISATHRLVRSQMTWFRCGQEGKL